MARTSMDFDFITAHLKNRPIAAILEQCDEKDDFKALQLLCIIDYYVEKANLYPRIIGSSCPKLISQLFQFRHFGGFRFYDFRANHRVKKFVLQCKLCELTGPYECILAHMKINHNHDTPLTICTFCNKMTFEKHFEKENETNIGTSDVNTVNENPTMEQCYSEYARRHAIVKDTNCDEIVAAFYDILRDISKKIECFTVRNQRYSAQSLSTVEKLVQNYDEDVSDECKVYQVKSRKTKTTIDNPKLTEEFERVTNHWFGGTAARSITKKARVDSVIIIIDSDEEGDAGPSAHPTQSGQSSGGNEAPGSVNEPRQKLNFLPLECVLIES